MMEGNKKREPVPERNHNMYFEKDHWKVIDIDGVDNLFVAKTEETKSSNTITGEKFDNDIIRIDVDGFAVNEGKIEKGDNINSSIWLNESQAMDLCIQIMGELEDRLEDLLED